MRPLTSPGAAFELHTADFDGDGWLDLFEDGERYREYIFFGFAAP